MARQAKSHGSVVKKFGPVLALLAVCQVSHAGLGDIDPAFGAGGVYAAPGPYSELLFQPDGRMVSASYSNGLLRVYRADADGHPDQAFAASGTADVAVDFTQMDWVYRTAIAPDGSTYHASRQKLVHVTASGLLDAGFGSAGIRSITSQDVGVSAPVLISSIAPLGGGNLAVLASYGTTDVYACPSGWKILRLLPNGQVDTSFGNGGSVAVAEVTQDCNETGSKSIQAMADGYLRIIDWYCPICERVIDSRGIAVQLPSAVSASVRGPVFQSDSGQGRNYLVGVSATDAANVLVARLNAGFSVDPAFAVAGNGIAAVRFPELVNEPHVYAAGGSQPVLYVQANLINSGRAGVFRLLADGSLDPTFNNGQILLLPVMNAGQIQYAEADGSLTFRSTRTTDELNQMFAFRISGRDLQSPGAFNVDGPGFGWMIYGNSVNVSRVLGASGAVSVRYRLTTGNVAPSSAVSTLAEGQLTWANGEVGPRSVSLSVSVMTGSNRYLQLVLEQPMGAPILQLRGAIDTVSVPTTNQVPTTSTPVSSATPPVDQTLSGGGGAFGCTGTLLCALLLAGRWAANCRRRYSRSRIR